MPETLTDSYTIIDFTLIDDKRFAKLVTAFNALRDANRVGYPSAEEDCWRMFFDDIPEDLVSMIAEFQNGEYDLISIARTSDTTGRLLYLPEAWELGRTGCMVSLIECFGGKVTASSQSRRWTVPSQVSGLRSLCEKDRELVRQCLHAAVQGPFFRDCEFHALFSLTRDEVATVLSRWPNVDDSREADRIAIHNSLINLTNYEHGCERHWSEFINASKDKVGWVFAKWCDKPTKVKLDFPQFAVAIPDLHRYLCSSDVPVGDGRFQLRGVWPSEPPAPEGIDLISVSASYGANWDGFCLGYQLSADVSCELYGQTRLNESDLRHTQLTYTDDRLNAKALESIPTEELIEQLREVKNGIPLDYGTVIPGGEVLMFSSPLKALMFRGEEARQPLLAHLNDQEIANEVVLALGAVGDETTVPILIAAYPRGHLDQADRAAVLTRVCFSYSLCWLTGQSIDRSREGTDLGDRDAEKWEAWWADNHEGFQVPVVKPYSTWVPSYPLLADEHVARIRTCFAEKGYEGWDYE